MQLTDVGLDAMAQELLSLASNGERDWDQESVELREEFRSFIDSMIDRARDAEERQAATTVTSSNGPGRVLP
jgi:hypothetical protein